MILTIPTLSGETIEDFSLRVANANGIGYKGYDNGILITLAMKEKRVRIELGFGMEKYISDAEAQTILDDEMIPSFKKGDFTTGLENGLNRLMEKARDFSLVMTNSVIEINRNCNDAVVHSKHPSFPGKVAFCKGVSILRGPHRIHYAPSPGSR